MPSTGTNNGGTSYRSTTLDWCPKVHQAAEIEIKSKVTIDDAHRRKEKIRSYLSYTRYYQTLAQPSRL